MALETEWRRRWKPDMTTATWRMIETENESFHMKSVFKDDSYEIMLTDFVVIWHESLEADEIIQRTKKLNPSVEAPLSKITDHLRSYVHEGKKGAEFSSAFKSGVDDGGDRIQLTLSTRLAGLPFTWRFYGSPVSKEEFGENLTTPLMIMVSELTRRQEQLFALLQRKDKEIEDLCAQNVRVSRKHLETGRFDETVFANNMTASKEFTEQVERKGRSAFGEIGVLQTEVLMKCAYLNRDPEEDEDDEGMADADAAGSTAAAVGTSWNNRLPPSLLSASSASPTKSPTKAGRTPDASPVKETELLRREALAKRLAEDGDKKNTKAKKKKKINF